MIKSIFHFYQMGGVKLIVQSLRARLTKSRTLLTLNRPDCKHPLYLRYPSSDTWVYSDIFVDKEYEFPIATNPKFIIDAGANIGLSAIFFANKFPDAKIVAIEPERSNFELLQKNIKEYPNVIALNAALWSESKYIDIIDPGLDDWGFMTADNDNQAKIADHLQKTYHQSVQAMTVEQIASEYSFSSIDILKLDIEGAEKEVFENCDAWIDRVNMIIVELHDHMKPGCSEAFYTATRLKKENSWKNGENIYMTLQRS